MAQQHSGERKSVVDLGQSHFCLVDLDGNVQTLSSGGYPFLNHLLNVVVQFPDQFQIAFCQSLFMSERNHIPVSLFGLVEYVLFRCFAAVFCHSLADVCHLVGCHDAAAHEQGLHQHDGTGKHVARVGMESIYDTLSFSIEYGTDGARQGWILTADNLHRTIPQMGEVFLLFIVEDGNLPAGIDICAQSLNAGQVFCPC